jgi:hypothetical protein
MQRAYISHPAQPHAASLYISATFPHAASLYLTATSLHVANLYLTPSTAIFPDAASLYLTTTHYVQRQSAPNFTVAAEGVINIYYGQSALKY